MWGIMCRIMRRGFDKADCKGLINQIAEHL